MPLDPEGPDEDRGLMDIRFRLCPDGLILVQCNQDGSRNRFYDLHKVFEWVKGAHYHLGEDN